MNSQTVLTERELDRLQAFLDAAGTTAMNIEGVDGYFAALICGPDVVLPSEYLPVVMGEDFVFDSEGEAADILGLLTRHWNGIAGQLLRGLKEPEICLPILLEDESGLGRGNDWARGFMRGVQMRSASWVDLIKSKEHGGLMLPMMLLAHENDPDPSMRPGPLAPERREEVQQMMIANLTLIYRHFEPQRRMSPRQPVSRRREGYKVGRNDPCPCGSGRKYKHCCLTAGPILH